MPVISRLPFCSVIPILCNSNEDSLRAPSRDTYNVHPWPGPEAHQHFLTFALGDMAGRQTSP